MRLLRVMVSISARASARERNLSAFVRLVFRRSESAVMVDDTYSTSCPAASPFSSSPSLWSKLFVVDPVLVTLLTAFFY